MISETQKWLKKLQDDDFIEKFDTGMGEYLRLTSGSIVHVPHTIIEQLQTVYDAAFEKGGLLFAFAEKRDGKNVLRIQSVQFITNASPFPERQYRFEPHEFHKGLATAEANQLLPFTFHTHPVEYSDGLQSLRFNRQMDTSEADKSASLWYLHWGETKLRLPDVLVIGNYAGRNDIFFGLYGGLVAPLDFTKRKTDLSKKLGEKMVTGFSDYLDTPAKQILAIGAALAALVLLIKHPKAILPTAMVAGTVLPAMAYGLAKEHEHFGLSGLRRPLEIALPKVPDEVIRQNEQFLLELFDKMRKEREHSAAA